jgi:FkbM family methyltransferase
MTSSEPTSIYHTLGVLFGKGVRYRTVIDVGCADGHFFLTMRSRGLADDAVGLNIDANDLYEPSLKQIHAALGGHYFIGAATDHEGTLQLTMAAHPYWASPRPPGDSYWKKIHGEGNATRAVEATTLDVLCGKLNLKGPFLFKMDVQGGEADVLRGAAGILKETSVVVCEADLDDFGTIHAELTKNDFALYDATDLHRLSDGSLGWFYPIYVNRTLEAARIKALWDEQDSAAVIAAQVSRRQAILKYNSEILARLVAKRPQGDQTPAEAAVRPPAPNPAISRNALCACGSGKKYKHCHGAFQ